ncbi:hypothetical protein SCOR_22925 [Sulfidibacter corallicola]
MTDIKRNILTKQSVNAQPAASPWQEDLAFDAPSDPDGKSHPGSPARNRRGQRNDAARDLIFI